MRKQAIIKHLVARGLTELEANILYSLLEKVIITNNEMQEFTLEIEKGLPFEGGISFAEALTGLKISMEK